MAIEATSPTIVSATYDKWAFSFTTNGFGLAKVGEAEAGRIQCTVMLAKYRVRDDGVCEQSPFPGDTTSITIEDLYAAMSTDSELAAAFDAIVACVQRIGAEQGKL